MERPVVKQRQLAFTCPWLAAAFAGLVAIAGIGIGAALWAQTAPSANSAQTSHPSASSSGAAPSKAALPRGKKLMLKDGSFQLVREYQVDGDRVRYYSLDTSSWEEMPADLIDWDRTKKVADEEAKTDAAEVTVERSREKARAAEPLDIDASYEVAPRVFLPPGEGLFAFDGKTILKLAQAPIVSKLDKKKVVAQVLVPVPIIPTEHNITIHRPHAEYRVDTGQPEFYMRSTGQQEPELELIKATTRGDSREVEKLDSLVGQQKLTKATIAMQRWQVAIGLYRFTLSESLPPGEYVLAEVIQDNGMNLYVWDFGVDSPTAAEKSKQKR
jgi:hypothetical protein